MYEVGQLPETHLVGTGRRVIWHDDLAKFKQLGQEEICRPSNVLRRINQLMAKHPEAKGWFITCDGRVGVTRKGFALLATRWDPKKRLAIDSLYSKARADARRETVGGKNMQDDQQKAHEPEPEEMTEGDTIPPESAIPDEEPKAIVLHVKPDDDGILRIDDDELADRLGYPVYPERGYDAFRRLIKEWVPTLRRWGVIATKTITPGPNGGRPGTAYRLNQNQATFMATRSGKPKAIDITVEIVDTFVAAQQHAQNQGTQLTPAVAAAIAAAVTTAMQPFLVELREQRQSSTSDRRRSPDFGFNPPPPPVTTKKKGQTSLRPFSAEAKRWLKIRMPVDQISGFVEDRLVAQGWAERDAPRNAHTKGNLLATPAGCESGYVVNYQATRPADGVVFPMALNLTKEGADYCQDMIRAEFLPSSGASPTRDGRQSDFFRGQDDGGERD